MCACRRVLHPVRRGRLIRRPRLWREYRTTGTAVPVAATPSLMIQVPETGLAALMLVAMSPMAGSPAT